MPHCINATILKRLKNRINEHNILIPCTLPIGDGPSALKKNHNQHLTIKNLDLIWLERISVSQKIDYFLKNDRKIE